MATTYKVTLIGSLDNGDARVKVSNTETGTSKTIPHSVGDANVIETALLTFLSAEKRMNALIENSLTRGAAARTFFTGSVEYVGLKGKAYLFTVS